LEFEKGQSAKQRNEKREYLRELIEVMEHIDESNGTYGYA